MSEMTKLPYFCCACEYEQIDFDPGDRDIDCPKCGCEMVVNDTKVIQTIDALKSQLEIATDLGQKRFEEVTVLQEKLTALKEGIQNTLDLARTGCAPMAFGMDETQWVRHKMFKIESELSHLLPSAPEVEK